MAKRGEEGAKSYSYSPKRHQSVNVLNHDQRPERKSWDEREREGCCTASEIMDCHFGAIGRKRRMGKEREANDSGIDGHPLPPHLSQKKFREYMYDPL